LEAFTVTRIDSNLQTAQQQPLLLQNVSEPVVIYDGILNLSVRVLDTLQQPGLLNGLDHAHFPGCFLLESCHETMYPTTRVIAADNLWVLAYQSRSGE
jgi:hypothetical protein